MKKYKKDGYKKVGGVINDDQPQQQQQEQEPLRQPAVLSASSQAALAEKDRIILPVTSFIKLTGNMLPNIIYNIIYIICLVITSITIINLITFIILFIVESIKNLSCENPIIYKNTLKYKMLNYVDFIILKTDNYFTSKKTISIKNSSNIEEPIIEQFAVNNIVIDSYNSVSPESPQTYTVILNNIAETLLPYNKNGDSMYTFRLNNISNNMCIRPENAQSPTNGTKVILSTLCNFNSTHGSDFVILKSKIQHLMSGLLLTPSDNIGNVGAHLILSTTYKDSDVTDFKLINNQLIHIKTGNCIVPDGVSKLVFKKCDNNDSSSKFRALIDIPLSENTIYIYSNIQSKTLAYTASISKLQPPAPQTSSSPSVVKSLSTLTGKNMINGINVAFKIKHTRTGLCVHPSGGSATPSNNTGFVLYNSCNDSPIINYYIDDSGSLKHKSSDMCIVPYGGNVTQSNLLVFWNNCDDKTKSSFVLENNILKHKSSGLCVVPSYCKGRGCNTGGNISLQLANTDYYKNEDSKFTFEYIMPSAPTSTPVQSSTQPSMPSVSTPSVSTPTVSRPTPSSTSTPSVSTSTPSVSTSTPSSTTNNSTNIASKMMASINSVKSSYLGITAQQSSTSSSSGTVSTTASPSATTTKAKSDGKKSGQCSIPNSSYTIEEVNDNITEPYFNVFFINTLVSWLVSLYFTILLCYLFTIVIYVLLKIIPYLFINSVVAIEEESQNDNSLLGNINVDFAGVVFILINFLLYYFIFIKAFHSKAVEPREAIINIDSTIRNTINNYNPTIDIGFMKELRLGHRANYDTIEIDKYLVNDIINNNYNALNQKLYIIALYRYLYELLKGDPKNLKYIEYFFIDIVNNNKINDNNPSMIDMGVNKNDIYDLTFVSLLIENHSSISVNFQNMSFYDKYVSTNKDLQKSIRNVEDEIDKLNKLLVNIPNMDTPIGYLAMFFIFSFICNIILFMVYCIYVKNDVKNLVYFKYNTNVAKSLDNVFSNIPFIKYIHKIMVNTNISPSNQLQQNANYNMQQDNMMQPNMQQDNYNPQQYPQQQI